MSNIIRPKRSAVPGILPAADPDLEGEIFINVADRKIGVHNEKGNPILLVPILFFADTARYKRHDLVVYQGAIYRALRDIKDPGPFRAVNWTGASGVGTGGTGVGMPIPTRLDEGKALVVNFGGQAEWGYDIKHPHQNIYGGQF